MLKEQWRKVAATSKTVVPKLSSGMSQESIPNIFSFGAEIIRMVGMKNIGWSSRNLSRHGVSSMTSSCKRTLSFLEVVLKPILLRVWELMQRRRKPKFSFSSRVSKAEQPESMLWRASSEMVTLSRVSCLRHGNSRASGEIKLGKWQPPNLATRSLGAKRYVDDGSRYFFSSANEIW